MKYAVISDLHANMSALRRVLDDARKMGAESIVCLGDVVGYGPLPAETAASVRKSASVVLAGNHDDAVSGRIDHSDFIDLANDSVERHRAQLHRDDIAWLRALPYTAELDGAVAVHGDLTDPESFNYVDNDRSAAANFAKTTAQLIFVGHTHVPCIYLTGASGRIYRLDPQNFVLEDGKRYIINPGSVGYPRVTDGKCFSSYVLYDSTARTVTFRTLPFAVSSVMQRGGLQRAPWVMPLSLAAIVAAIVAIAIFSFPRNQASERAPTNAGELQAVPSARGNVIAEKSLALPSAAKTVSAKLQLARKSAPAQLETIFSDADGNTLYKESKTVKVSFTRAINIPGGATSVRFVVLRSTKDGTPTIASFEPEFRLTKKGKASK